MNTSNELKIDLYPEKKPRYEFPISSVNNFLPFDTVYHSFNSKPNLAYMDTNTPLLYGFYTAHTNHYPIRLEPDDIWLLILQDFSNHVNEILKNSEVILLILMEKKN